MILYARALVETEKRFWSQKPVDNNLCKLVLIPVSTEIKSNIISYKDLEFWLSYFQGQDMMNPDQEEQRF